MENKYKALLLTLGLTVSGATLSYADKDNPLDDERERSPTKQRIISPLFIEVDQDAEKRERDDWNVGCSVTNSACK